jgi:hypothetical protein
VTEPATQAPLEEPFDEPIFASEDDVDVAIANEEIDSGADLNFVHPVTSPAPDVSAAWIALDLSRKESSAQSLCLSL